MAASIGAEDGDVGFQIAPMVDVVFVLLLFFMASAGMRMVEKELAVQVPGRSEQSVVVPIAVEISDDGMVSVNGQSFGGAQDRQLDRVRTWFKAGAEQFGHDPVVIRPSNGARLERIVDVLDALSASGVSKLSFS